MPYIKNQDRENLDSQINDIVIALRKFGSDNVEGPTNYVVSRIISGVFVQDDGSWRYKLLNRAIGTLESVKQELYRRLVGPYEDKCIELNGDIQEYIVSDNKE